MLFGLAADGTAVAVVAFLVGRLAAALASLLASQAFGTASCAGWCVVLPEQRARGDGVVPAVEAFRRHGWVGELPSRGERPGARAQASPGSSAQGSKHFGEGFFLSIRLLYVRWVFLRG